MFAVDFSGDSYRGEASAPQHEFARRTLGACQFKGDEHILDLCCGDGSITAKLAALVPEGQVVGVDSSEGMIRAARFLEGLNLSFEQGDVLDMAFKNRFDLIFSNAGLHWIHDHDRLLRLCHEALKAEGRIQAEFPARDCWPRSVDVVRLVMEQGEFAKYFEGFKWPWFTPDKDEYAEVLAESPFQDFKIDEYRLGRNFGGPKAFSDWLRQAFLIPFLSRITVEKERRRFEDIVIQKILERMKSDETPNTEGFHRLNITAVK